jgi:hypothetical protein
MDSVRFLGSERIDYRREGRDPSIEAQTTSMTRGRLYSPYYYDRHNSFHQLQSI